MKGLGWDCREVRQRGKHRYRILIGHLGRQKWDELQARLTPAEIEDYLIQWVEDRRRERRQANSGKQ